ncbi:MerR family transcriptional regulator [Xanthobacter aminoxidans]|uniref:MerR family transcriptional regulator n=1 Tax=Xanthobacter aminoxidans TaxID=186280 RepID=UPI003727C9FA
MSFATEKCYTASTACAVAEVPPSTLRAWRNNNGLLSGPAHKGWNRFSIVDLCVIRLVSQLTKRGMQADDACKTAPFIGLSFHSLIDGEHPSRFVWITDQRVVYANEDMTISKYLDNERTPNEVALFVDLRTILSHVMKYIIDLKPETFMSSEDLDNLISKTMADVLRPPPEDQESNDQPAE